MSTLIWFRDDLRLADHAALVAAADDPEGVIALYIHDQLSPGIRPLGGAAQWWLHHSLHSLQSALGELDVPLILRSGEAEQIIAELVQEFSITRVVWNRRYGVARQHDARIKAALKNSGVEARSFAGDVLFEPWTIETRSGTPYQQYSAFWRACTSAPAPSHPLDPPSTLQAAAKQPDSDDLHTWNLLPQSPDWSIGIAERWKPGESQAAQVLERFLRERVAGYAKGRDVPSEDTGSELSPYLRWGEISPRTVWHRALESGRDIGEFLGELGWREFAKHTAFHFGPLHERNLRPEFDTFPWRPGERDELDAWQRGQTGFGLVDAGMRELWETGFMHNRVRMITASFLTKNLLTHWKVGEAWFWDTLVDADEASNPFNWQWVAGSGADAAPYFRIFNPELQQEKFDGQLVYTNLWAADSCGLPPMVDLKATRQRALSAYEAFRRESRKG